MFPYPNGCPTYLIEFFNDAGVSCTIRSKFLAPKCRIAPGHPTTLRTVMPKAAVNKDGKPRGSETKIRLSWQMGMPPPAFYGCRFHDRNKSLLSAAVVFPADRSHKFGSLFNREKVSHDDVSRLD